jgi:teichuronic acid biosynthesis glycosyltransferase TuaG
VIPSLVSIITPAYRAGAFVQETIRSAQRQQHVEWEMLVVDDCSPDDTSERVSEVARTDERVRLIRQPTNRGPAVARNTALEAARGRFVAFLDSDDLWLPAKLSTQLNFMQARGAAISYTGFRRMSSNGQRLGHRVTVPASLTYRQLLCNTAIATSTAMVDQLQTGPIRVPMAPYDDFAAWLSILRRGFVAYGLNEDLMRYRVLEHSISRSKSRSASWVWRTYREIEGLGLFHSCWCFANYAVRGWVKYRRF